MTERKPTTENEKRDRVRGQLCRWGQTTAICKRKQDEISGYLGLIDAAEDAIGAQKLTGMPHAGRISDPTASAAVRAETLKKLYRQRIEELQSDICMLLDFARLMDEIIDELTPDEQQVLDRRYKCRWGWDKMARKLYRSERSLRRVEARAVDKLVGCMDFTKMD